MSTDSVARPSCSISLTIMQGTNYDIGLKEKLQKASETNTEEETTTSTEQKDANTKDTETK